MGNKKFKTKIFISTIIIFLIGTLFHFVYGFLGNNFLVGLIAPINESVWEHLKLATTPILLWWLICYLIKNKKYGLDKGKWFLGCLVSIIVSNFIILGVYYFVRYGLDIESTIINIILLYIAILLGQFTGHHIYKFSKVNNFYFPVIAIYAIIILFMILTIVPPKLPLFEDPTTHTYGIYKQLKK
ncbi:MAG: DUF6512 family protein [Bacilli bacterium]|nr:DUF6512 family protein [Bacilli bacterium]MDD4282911.1 DUF6512 family protein [Bacilli bacterium]MDD4719107.1 DUF6512 family protein [Bacilli bacterium]